MIAERIAGTSYQRLYEPTEDITLAFVVSSDALGSKLWCIGCVLEPTQEVVFAGAELSDHVLLHLQEAQRHDYG